MENKGIRLLIDCLDKLSTKCACVTCTKSNNDLIGLIKVYLQEVITTKCTICNITILMDESYIQNCDGMQHIQCYMKG